MNIFKFLYYQFFRPKIFFPKKSYAYFKEDLFINNFFKKKFYGFYVDVGAYHPLEGNNTHLLYKKKNWSGINIDISNLSIDLFKVARKNDLNLSIGISNTKKKLKVYFRRKINVLNTLNKKIAKIQFPNGFYEKKIQVDKLDNILNNSKYKNRKIDFLNIDVEGEELNVLKSLNFKKYKPKLICVEIHNRDKIFNNQKKYLLNNNVYKFLLKRKYKIVWNHKYSYIFKRT